MAVLPIILTPAGGSAGAVSGKLSIASPARANVSIQQIIGFVPLIDCDFDECRDFPGSCYINPVFGSVGVSSSTYENDLNTFYFNDTLHRTVRYILQKQNIITKTWTSVAILSTSPTSYGINYPYGSFVGKPHMTGFRINWGSVLTLQGAGNYRIRLSSNGSLGNTGRFPICLVSEPFKLLPFSCELADRTVKFESRITGKIGSITTDGAIFDLCNNTLYDSIRVPGFFGHETTSYDSVQLEYQTGLIDPVRDEAVQKFKFQSRLLPKYIHDRFKTYGLMADELKVSDYNMNNSDYDIKQKRVVKDGAYEPVYHKGNLQSSVTVDFKEGIQGVIKSNACD